MIFLKKIELNGFKSYAQLTTITFANNFVGIIGPNGSGKTNIVDAIR
ncbi:AAA family ATPase [bacterium]|nr:AAA family ATPase [bacterium]